MARPLSSQPSQTKRRTTQKSTKAPRIIRKRKSSGKKKTKQQSTLLRDFLLFSLECVGLAIIGMAAIIVLLGYFGNRFSGTDFVSSLLPFAGGILTFSIFASLALSIWKRLRKWLQKRSPQLPPAIVLVLTLLVCSFVPQAHFTRAFGYYRTLVGGKEEAGRVALAHQVYAAYRRLDIVPLSKMINRSEQVSKVIEEAAEAYAIDVDLLKGLAAAESSYLPRKSNDGGQGLFQITRIPTSVTEDVNKLFPKSSREMTDPRYNAFLGAATLRHYLNEMNKDLFLGLLAYNIGPGNGGLRFIMQQYGVTDFTTIQPYLLRLPRDYPIRVLSYALAFRIDRKEGRLLAYEEGKNALSIQALGIPGQ
jgi:soluble lytic murein transglycosylase-like protein